MSEEQWQIYAALRDARTIYDDPFFDPDFARLVGEVRADTRIGFASDRRGVFAVWPMHIRPGNWARPIGSPFSDWNGPILSQDTELLPQEILAGFEISGITTQGYLPVDSTRTTELDRVGANLSDLSDGWDAFYVNQEQRWPKHFKKMRRVYRNVARDFAEKRFVWDDTSDASFQRLLDLKQDQFARTGYHDVLKAPWTRALFDRLRSFQGPRLRSRVSTLSYDNHLAAAELNLESDTVLHGWITAFDQRFSAYSPGNMLVQEVLERMCDDGIKLYDAGPGLDHYKRHYANLQVPIELGVISGNVSQLTPARMAGHAWRFGEQLMPGKAATIMARARRRMDQIASVETSFAGRASGILNALHHRPI